MSCCRLFIAHLLDTNEYDLSILTVCILTERGDTSATEVLPDVLAVRTPGMLMGSGDNSRDFKTAGSSGLPQLSQEKPTI